MRNGAAGSNVQQHSSKRREEKGREGNSRPPASTTITWYGVVVLRCGDVVVCGVWWVVG